MQKIAVIERENACERTKELVNAVEKKLGVVPNIFLTMGKAPAVLQGYLQFSESLSEGKLCPQLREKIALATAGKNNCDYCASAHTFLGQKVGIDKEELKKNLESRSDDPKSEAVLRFVHNVLENKGRVDSIQTLIEVGLSEEEIVEVIGHIGMNIFTNYFNNVINTEIDFPIVSTCETNKCSS